MQEKQISPPPQKKIEFLGSSDPKCSVDLPRMPPQGFWVSLHSSQANAFLWWGRSVTLSEQSGVIDRKQDRSCCDWFIPWLECLHLKASGVWRLSFSTWAGLQRFVEMVNGLTGGIFHRQQAVFSHPATIEGLVLWVCWKNIDMIYLMTDKIITIICTSSLLGLPPDIWEDP